MGAASELFLEGVDRGARRACPAVDLLAGFDARRDDHRRPSAGQGQLAGRLTAGALDLSDVAQAQHFAAAGLAQRDAGDALEGVELAADFDQ